MSTIEPLALNTSSSNHQIIPNTYQVNEIKQTFFFSPIKYTKVVKLPPNNPSLYNNLIPMNYPQINNSFQSLNKKTLVLDLDETLVHSSMNPLPNGSHLILPINVAGKNYNVYVLIRPFLEQFLMEMSLLYEIVIFTASLAEYAEPLLKIIDKNKVVKHILNRNHCLFYQGLFIKDLKVINRDIKDLIIIDNNPVSYSLNKENGIPILSWFDNPNDNELMKLVPLLKYLSSINDVRPIINQIVNKKTEQIDFNIIDKIINEENIINDNISNLKNINNLNNQIIFRNIERNINDTINASIINNNSINNIHNIHKNNSINNKINKNNNINSNNNSTKNIYLNTNNKIYIKKDINRFYKRINNSIKKKMFNIYFKNSNSVTNITNKSRINNNIKNINNNINNNISQNISFKNNMEINNKIIRNTINSIKANKNKTIKNNNKFYNNNIYMNKNNENKVSTINNNCNHKTINLINKNINDNYNHLNKNISGNIHKNINNFSNYNLNNKSNIKYIKINNKIKNIYNNIDNAYQKNNNKLRIYNTVNINNKYENIYPEAKNTHNVISQSLSTQAIYINKKIKKEQYINNPKYHEIFKRNITPTNDKQNKIIYSYSTSNFNNNYNKSFEIKFLHNYKINHKNIFNSSINHIRESAASPNHILLNNSIENINNKILLNHSKENSITPNKKNFKNIDISEIIDYNSEKKSNDNIFINNNLKSQNLFDEINRSFDKNIGLLSYIRNSPTKIFNYKKNFNDKQEGFKMNHKIKNFYDNNNKNADILNKKIIKIKIHDNTKKNNGNNIKQKFIKTEYENEYIEKYKKNRKIEIENPLEFLKSPRINKISNAKKNSNNKENNQENGNKISDINIK